MIDMNEPLNAVRNAKALLEEFSIEKPPEVVVCSYADSHFFRELLDDMFSTLIFAPRIMIEPSAKISRGTCRVFASAAEYRRWLNSDSN